MSLLDPEVDYEDTILPDHVGETYRGHEGVSGLRALDRAFEELTIELEGSSERAIASSPSTEPDRRRDTPASSSKGRSPTSGRSESGRVIRSGRFWIRTKALEAAGLSE